MLIPCFLNLSLHNKADLKQNNDSFIVLTITYKSYKITIVAKQRKKVPMQHEQASSRSPMTCFENFS